MFRSSHWSTGDITEWKTTNRRAESQSPFSGSRAGILKHACVSGSDLLVKHRCAELDTVSGDRPLDVTEAELIITRLTLVETISVLQ
jgi:hypothetical protein